MSQALVLSTTDPVVRTAVSFMQRLFPAPRPYSIMFWDGTELPAEGPPQFSLVLKHPGALRRMFTPPIELALGKAYIYGDFDIEGDIFSAYALAEHIAGRNLSAGRAVRFARLLLALPRPGPARPAARGPARLRGRPHSRQRDLAAIQYHYDVGNEFYSLWLDRNLQYSCAYFPTGKEDLDRAQEQKMEHICRKLRLKHGERLLDIGCGWGGLAVYAATHCGVRSVGVSLSAKQVAYAQDWIKRLGIDDRVRVELKDYRDLGQESFDKIVSVGMFEHVGRSRLQEYFAQANRLLKPGGLFLNHGISHRALGTSGPAPATRAKPTPWRNFAARRLLGAGLFSQRFVFPDGELVPLSRANLMAEAAGLEVRDVENLREHYALTLRHWVQRLEAKRAEAIQVSNETTYRTWRLFMSASVYGFESANINVNQTLLAKTDAGRWELPLTRADLYADD